MLFATARAELADLIAPIVRALPHVEPDPTAPCAMVYPPVPFDYSSTFEDVFPFSLRVLLLAGSLSARSGQLSRLDAWISTEGDDSVVVAIQADGRFQVAQLLTYGVTALADGATQYYGAELDVVCFSLT
jgi:hypothetical protein